MIEEKDVHLVLGSGLETKKRGRTRRRGSAKVLKSRGKEIERTRSTSSPHLVQLLVCWQSSHSDSNTVDARGRRKGQRLFPFRRVLDSDESENREGERRAGRTFGADHTVLSCLSNSSE